MAKFGGTSELVAYDEDFHRWGLEQIELLEARRLRDLDVVNLIEELKALVGSTEREIESRMMVLLLHLLKWQYQPSHRSNSWRGTIAEQRYRIARELAKSPSLRRYPAEVLAEEYQLARLKASGETGSPIETFPDVSPYSAAQALDADFWPGSPDHKGK